MGASVTTETDVPHKTYVPTVNISEIYGPVIQGEGWRIGGPTVFVRTGGCDYRCEWCDSLYAVLPEYRDEWQAMTPDDIIDKVVELLPEGTKTGHMTLSGGNPVIQNARAMGDLLDAARRNHIRVGVETQGTRFSTWTYLVNDMTISPKPPSSGNVTPYGEDSAIERYIENVEKVHVSLKIVVFNDADWQYAKLVHMRFPDTRMYVQVGTDVGEDTRDSLLNKLDELQQRVISDAGMQDVFALPQLHVVMKGHARGI